MPQSAWKLSTLCSEIKQVTPGQREQYRGKFMGLSAVYHFLSSFVEKNRVIVVEKRTRSKADVTKQCYITLQDKPIVYHLVRVRRRKRLTVLVNGRGVLQVRIPWQVSQSQAEQFIHQQTAWILKRLQQVQRNIANQPSLQEGSVLPFLNDSLLLCHGKQQIQPVIRVENRLWVIHLDQSAEEVAQRLEQWYRLQARQHFSIRLEYWSRKMGVSFNRFTVRGQKSRWGSCSAKKSISLNWRLLFLPANVVDYVVVHELCHLLHMNHSNSFWSVVTHYIPDHATYRQQLRQFSPPW